MHVMCIMINIQCVLYIYFNGGSPKLITFCSHFSVHREMATTEAH